MQKTAIKRKHTHPRSMRTTAHKVKHVVRTVTPRTDGYDLYDRLEAIKDSLVDLTENVKDKTATILKHSIKDAKVQSSHVNKRFNRYITKKPFKTLGITALACFVIGYFMHRAP